MLDSKIVLILFFGLLISCQSANKSKQDSENEEQLSEDVKSRNSEAPANQKQFKSDKNASAEKGIRIENPTAGSTVSFPIEITGEAKGNWFFEAEFTVRLVQNGNELALAIVKAQDEWMTSDYVPFSATMNFDTEGHTGEASLVFKNSNPSGNPELDKEFTIPVEIEN
jgi:hypothetical protein